MQECSSDFNAAIGKICRKSVCWQILLLHQLNIALKIKFIKDDDEGILPYFKEEDAEKLDF